LKATEGQVRQGEKRKVNTGQRKKTVWQTGNRKKKTLAGFSDGKKTGGGAGC